jgi:hypothetical protein
MYPPGIYANQIADAVLSIFAAKEPESLELFFDDVELIKQGEQVTVISADPESESEEINGLLEDNYDENYDDKGVLKQLNSPFKIADDEGVDTDNDN